MKKFQKSKKGEIIYHMNMKNIIKKWWFWLIIFIIFYASSQNVQNTQNIDINTQALQELSPIVNEDDTPNEQYVYFDTFSTYLSDKTSIIINNSTIFTNYKLSSIGNSIYEIYLYANMYYNLENFSKYTNEICTQFITQIREKEYKPKYFAPNEILLRLYFCGYGKDLNTKKIRPELQPLATFSVKTNELKDIEDISSKIQIDDYWF